MLATSQRPRNGGGDLPTSAGTQALRLWWLPLLAGLLPAVGIAIAFPLAVAEGQFASCNPLIDGCVTISRAGRHGLPNILFRAFLMAGAVLQGAVWCLALPWLRSLGAAPSRRLAWLPWLGVAAALVLVVYGTFLGTEGAGYRGLRRAGVILYFGFSVILMLGVGGAVRRAVQAGTRLGPWPILLLASVIALPLAGVVNSFAPLVISDAVALDRFENATEWWAGLAFTVFFTLLALLWRRTGYVAQLHTLGRRAGP